MKFTIPVSLYEDENYNKLRRGYLILLASIFDKEIDDEISNHIDNIIMIEKSCYNHAVNDANIDLIIPNFGNSKFEDLYRSKIIRITKNMDITSEVGDRYLIKSILSNEIDLQYISYMKPEELSPSKNKDLLQKLTNRQNQQISYKKSTLYKCSSCKRNETLVKSVQMRSLDEGETLVITCTFCHNKWFIN
jgi:DNA-directed RNA polymerase subunit M/transcription elongation factor TFIIS